MRLEEALLAAYEGHAAITLVEPVVPGALAQAQAPRGAPRAPSQFDLDELPTPVALRKAPAVNETAALHARFDEAAQDGARDLQYRIAAVLVQRGAATPAERVVHEAHARVAPPRPVRALTAEAWDRLFHPEADRLTGSIFGVVASAALLGRVSALRRDRSLPALDPAMRQDAAASTVSAVRAVGWAAATLGLHAPPIYVAPEVDVGFELLTAVPPALRIGREMLSGRSALELAFHAGRQLTWLREELFVCTLVPSVAYLEDVFVAALSLGDPSIELLPEVRARTSLVADAIRPVLDGAKVARLAAHVQRFLAEGGKTSLRLWAQGADATSLRAGLLLCGDLATAEEVTRREPSAAERIADLERFWTSEDATALRRALGVSLDD